jgi:hypothetical protein
MRVMPPSGRAARALPCRPMVALACAVAVPWLALSPAAMGGTATASLPGAAATAGGGSAVGQSGQTTPPIGKANAVATLQQCATATIPQAERAATFAGEMSTIPGTARMEIRIELEERGPEELLYHTVSAPGLGVWHNSVAGVKIFAHIQQVTDLSAPALYRGAVRFRWLNDKNRPIRTDELHTARCEQPAPSSGSAGTGFPGTGSSGTSSTGTSSTGTGSTGTGSGGTGSTGTGSTGTSSTATTAATSSTY